ncbi:MAG: hypothetical protein KC593_26180, partial [Myxococcales bacterium]|nr:hypothetical protein [Myxococcales bacterium]
GSPEDMEDLEIEGLIVTDLVDTRAGLQQFMLVPGDYSSVRAELSRAGLPLPLGAPAELETSSLVVQGLTASGRRFTIALDDEMDIDIVAAMGSFLVAPERSRLVLSFDIAQWFSDIDLDALAPSSDGSVRVDADTNTDALTAFEASFLGALELGLDRNGNATLDDDEERLARGEAP